MPILRNSFNTKGASKLFEFTQGIDLDQHLGREEIRVQLAWAKNLKDLGFLSSAELEQAQKYLLQAQEEILAGSFDWRVEDEDIHMNLERYLTDQAGDLGKKIHFGRSRNDLIATTLRLFCQRSAIEAAVALKNLIAALVQKAESDLDTLIPGQTHLQHGQPLRLAQFWLAHAQAFTRDLQLFAFAADRATEFMPLGAGALNGVSLAIPLEKLAKDLGFQNAPANSYDAVADRDFMLDLLRALSSVGIHYSRLSEDIIIYASSAIGLLKLPKAYSTGSSMMPNKRNPDVAELTRGKSAHLISALGNASTLMKGLPLSYNSDLHELKRVLLRGLEDYAACAQILPDFIAGIECDPEVSQSLLKKGNILATFVAENKVLEGLSFREAYTQTAEMISKNDGAFQNEGPNFLKALNTAVESKNNLGGTGRAQIQNQIAALKKRL